MSQYNQVLRLPAKGDKTQEERISDLERALAAVMCHLGHPHPNLGIVEAGWPIRFSFEKNESGGLDTNFDTTGMDVA